MGLIRKSLAVGTLGVVRGNSKKQRVAKKTMRNTGTTARNTAATGAAVRKGVAADERRHQEEMAYRYATDPTYRAYIDQQRADAAEAARLQYARQAAQTRVAAIRATQAVALPVLAALLLLMVVLVWVPQMAVGRLRSRPVAWQREPILGAWTALLKWT